MKNRAAKPIQTKRSMMKPLIKPLHLRDFCLRDSGNSLIEVAVVAPIMVLLVFYAVNYGYFFIVASNLTASARSAGEYSVQGFSSPSGAALPAAGSASAAASVASLALGDLGNLARASTTASVEVCSPSANTSGGSTVACASYGPSTLSFTPDADPESAMFKCNRVDVVYTVQPPIPLSFFGTALSPPAVFHRMVEMRVMN